MNRHEISGKDFLLVLRQEIANKYLTAENFFQKNEFELINFAITQIRYEENK